MRSLWICCALAALGCSASEGSSSSEISSGPGGAGGVTSSGGAGASVGGANVGGNGASGGFMPGVGGGAVGGGSNCSGLLPATVRDFSSAHPDFETFSGIAAYPGIVESDLGADDKPVYASAGNTPQTTGPNEFAQWYNDVPNVNEAFAIQLQLVETAPGEFTYDNSAFFPIDGMGFGNEGNSNNFHFTTEIHTSFHYQGGEVFTFTGDDDLWMFINGKLAIDLGGLHPQLSATIDLDTLAGALGISIGGNYPMDIFHAERHTDQSNFRIQTTISCFTPPPQ
jgi:fibro-slime domain-containing protein